MKRIAAFAVAAFVSCAGGCAHQSATRDPADTVRELLALHEQWATARIQGDIAFLEQFYGPELRLQVMDGSVVQRSADIDLFRRVAKADAEVIRPSYIKDVDMRVTPYGNTAVVTGVEDLKGTYRGQYGEMSLRFTNVMVHRDGRWQLVSHQSTRVPTR